DARFLFSIVCARQSDLDGARYWLAEARKIDVERPNSPTFIYHLSALSELAAAEKRWDEAIPLLESIIQITTKTEQRWEEAHKLLELAEIYRRRRKSGDRELARAHYTEALDLFTDMGATGYVEVIQARLSQVQPPNRPVK
ncbi:MAG: tetratricopeptide repeat protein, partial [Chloroflexota bacterium]